MLISRGDLEWYRSALIDIGEQAAQSVRESLESSSGSISEMREAAIDSITTSIGIYGDQAQALAGQLFDEVCAAEGIGADPFELFDDIIDLDMLAGKVRYFARSLVESNKGKYLDDCSMLADFYARRCNYESMIRNCYKNNVRYARVPTGPDTCDFCLMLASRGFVYYDQARAEEGSHMHCVVGDTRVSAYDLLGAQRRHYQGPLVHIVTADGNDLTITPNHPILTTNGWVRAGEVNDGDYLICAGFNHWNTGGAPYEDHVQPKIEDVFSSLSFLNPSGFHSMPATAEDFHGDAIEDVKIDVVWANGLLKDVPNAALSKPTVHDSFEATVPRMPMKSIQLSGVSVSDLFHERDSSTTGSIVSSLGLSRPFGASHLGCSDTSSGAASSALNARLIEPSEQSGTGDSVAFGECIQTLAGFVAWKKVIGHGDSLGIGLADLCDIHADSLEVLAKGIGITSELTSDGGYGFPIPIEISRVVHKSVSVSTCHVYNLTTSSSWYFANGIITHNCDCVIIPGNGADATSATQIEGYDPELLYDLWQGQISDTAHKRASKNGTSYQVERMRIMDRYSRGSKNARARKRLR